MKKDTVVKLKFKRLQRQLRLPLWQAIGLLESIWHCALTNAPDGDIGRLTNDDIAAAIEWDGDADNLIHALVECEWLDEDSEFRLIVHDWSQHIPTYLTGSYRRHGKLFADEVAKHRAKEGAKHGALEAAKHSASDPASYPSLSKPIPFKNKHCGEPAAPATPPDAETATATPPLLAPDLETFEAFWRVYPPRDGRRRGKEATRQAWRKLSDADRTQLLVATAEYARSSEVRRGFARDPERFLRKGYWRSFLTLAGNVSAYNPEESAETTGDPTYGTM